MASVSGSRLAFFGNDPTGANVNIVLTPDGTGALATVAGAYNIEVFTSSVGSPSLAPGFQASAFIEGATNIDPATGLPFANNVLQAGSITTTEQLLGGSFTVVDQTGFETIQIVGSGGAGAASNDTVVAGRADTIIGSTIAGNTQVIDASSVGFTNITAGSGNTTVLGGDFSVITGAAGPLTVVGAVGAFHTHITVNGGVGGLAAFDFGTKNSITGGANITFIDDTYGSGGQSTLVGGTGGSNFVAGGAGDSLVGGTGPVTILDSFLFAGQTVVGGSGLSTIIEGGQNDSIVSGSGFFAFVSATTGSIIRGGTNAIGATDVYSLGDSNTVTGGAGTLIVGAAATNSLIEGGSGDLQVFGLGAGNTVFGSTAGTTTINDVLGGGAQLIGGAGATTIIAGAGDSIVGAAGNMNVNLRSDIGGTETINLAAGADVVRDNSIAGGAGAIASVTGFNVGADTIASATSVDASNNFQGSSTVIAGNTVLTFLDGSTMTIVGVTAGIQFAQ